MSNIIYILSFLGKCFQIGDYTYDLAFQATGCRNRNQTQSQITWWKKQSDNKVFSDMFEYCVLVRDGKASPSQKQQCCGEAKECKTISCNKQTTSATDINSFVSL